MKVPDPFRLTTEFAGNCTLLLNINFIGYFQFKLLLQ
jgi:hypothetical protein